MSFPMGPKKNDVVRIATFMNDFLNVEMIETIPYPNNIRGQYDDLDDEEKNQWLEYTFDVVFLNAHRKATGLLGRVLSFVESNLIKRRIINFFKQSGIGTTRDDI